MVILVILVAKKLVEEGIEVENIAESGLLEYNQLQSIWQL